MVLKTARGHGAQIAAGQAPFVQQRRWQIIIFGGTQRIRIAISERVAAICQPQGLGFESLLRSQFRIQNLSACQIFIDTGTATVQQRRLSLGAIWTVPKFEGAPRALRFCRACGPKSAGFPMTPIMATPSRAAPSRASSIYVVRLAKLTIRIY